MGAQFLRYSHRGSRTSYTGRSHVRNSYMDAAMPNGADQPFHERMGEWRVGRGFDFLHFQYSKIGLPLLEPEQRIVIRTEVLGNRPPSNRLLEHPAQRHSIDDSGLHAKPNDLARVLVHHDQYPVRSQDRGLAPEQIDAPQTVLHMAQKGKPGWTAGSGYRPAAYRPENERRFCLPPLEDHRSRSHFTILSRCRAGPNTSCNTTMANASERVRPHLLTLSV